MKGRKKLSEDNNSDTARAKKIVLASRQVLAFHPVFSKRIYLFLIHVGLVVFSVANVFRTAAKESVQMEQVPLPLRVLHYLLATKCHPSRWQSCGNGWKSIKMIRIQTSIRKPPSLKRQESVSNWLLFTNYKSIKLDQYLTFYSLIEGSQMDHHRPEKNYSVIVWRRQK